MLNNLLSAVVGISLVIAAFLKGKKSGKQDLETKIIKNELKDIQETKVRREERANIPVNSKREFLRKRNKD